MFKYLTAFHLSMWFQVKQNHSCTEVPPGHTPVIRESMEVSQLTFPGHLPSSQQHSFSPALSHCFSLICQKITPIPKQAKEIVLISTRIFFQSLQKVSRIECSTYSRTSLGCFRVKRGGLISCQWFKFSIFSPSHNNTLSNRFIFLLISLPFH